MAQACSAAFYSGYDREKITESEVTKRVYMSLIGAVDGRGRASMKWEGRMLE